MPNHVVIIGSINVDAILHIQRLPKPGETMEMAAFLQAAGGKGANQAVAAARSGAKTSFIGRVGDDANAAFMRGELVKNKIDTQYVSTTSGEQTGQAYILLQASGQNSIIIQHGANFDLTPNDVQKAATLIQTADFVVAELETPVDATTEAFKIAKAAGKVTILNPAPAQKDLPLTLLKNVDLITPNETESELITGIPVTDEASMRASAAYYHELGIRGVIITLGSKGSFISLDGQATIVPAFKVKAVDTTAAGDTFIGALASVLQIDLKNIVEAATYASMASSFTVQKLGAFPSIPMGDDVKAKLDKIRK
ncbi:ribokinase [Lacticaseibacillus casei]|uniref:ribokinase n=1 Tax=Lacticaseibacillus casei TaxID=1582 RepID=UPI0011088EDB|nr:ribokinase [Lacticaseibacillus casei]TLQ51390.1 ribokinase [Lacticaseibacillus casei]